MFCLLNSVLYIWFGIFGLVYSVWYFWFGTVGFVSLVWYCKWRKSLHRTLSPGNHAFYQHFSPILEVVACQKQVVATERVSAQTTAPVHSSGIYPPVGAGAETTVLDKKCLHFCYKSSSFYSPLHFRASTGSPHRRTRTINKQRKTRGGLASRWRSTSRQAVINEPRNQ